MWSATVHGFVVSALSSYHAVQGWMDELRIHVGEACELALVDVGNDQLIRRGQHRLRTCEKLVKVFCSFATLKENCGEMWRRAIVILITRKDKKIVLVNMNGLADSEPFIRELPRSPRGKVVQGNVKA